MKWYLKVKQSETQTTIYDTCKYRGPLHISRTDYTADTLKWSLIK